MKQPVSGCQTDAEALWTITNVWFPFQLEDHFVNCLWQFTHSEEKKKKSRGSKVIRENRQQQAAAHSQQLLQAELLFPLKKGLLKFITNNLSPQSVIFNSTLEKFPLFPSFSLVVGAGWRKPSPLWLWLVSDRAALPWLLLWEATGDAWMQHFTDKTSSSSSTGETRQITLHIN